MRTLLAFILLMLAYASDTSAQDRVRPLRFLAGEYATTVNGVVQGYDVHDYVLRAREGQRIRVELSTPHAAEAFIMNDETFENVGSQLPGRMWEFRLPYSGAYRIRVLQPRPSAHRGERSQYSLYVEII